MFRGSKLCTSIQAGALWFTALNAQSNEWISQAHFRNSSQACKSFLWMKRWLWQSNYSAVLLKKERKKEKEGEETITAEISTTGVPDSKNSTDRRIEHLVSLKLKWINTHEITVITVYLLEIQCKPWREGDHSIWKCGCVPRGSWSTWPPHSETQRPSAGVSHYHQPASPQCCSIWPHTGNGLILRKAPHVKFRKHQMGSLEIGRASCRERV